MVVTSQCNGRRVTGLYVGAGNVRRYFSKRATQIELRLDHLLIECGLPRDSGAISRRFRIPVCAFGSSQSSATATDTLPFRWP